MSTLHLVPEDIRKAYEVHEWRNATGVLQTAKAARWEEIQAALRTFKLLRSEVLKPGGRRSLVTERFEKPLKESGWVEKHFNTAIEVDGVSIPSPTHKVDCFNDGVALEMEWNNKDPFYDRDLNNFRLLFDLRIVEVGVIVTRATHLQDIFDKLGRGKSYGTSTTHMGKLTPKLDGGGGGGCPILVFGITKELYVEDPIPEAVEAVAEVEDDEE